MKHIEQIEKLSLQEKAEMLIGKTNWMTRDVERLNIPSLILSDGPHGLRKEQSNNALAFNQSYPATCYPTASCVANSFDTSLAIDIGKHLALEAKAQDVQVILGPGVNIKRNPLCGRNFEYFSEDPYLAGKMGASYIKGIQSEHVGACIKHFAANNQETRRMIMNSVIDERALNELYLMPFEMAIKDANPYCLMSSYNLINGAFSNENKHTLKHILRNKWGYKGLVMTDWGGENNILKGLEAGSDLQMPNDGGYSAKEIQDAVLNQNFPVSILDEAIDHLLSLIDLVNIPKRKYSFYAGDHHEFATYCAEQSIVLLKNKENVLPIYNTKKVAIIGDFAFKPRYQGAGSSIVNPTILDTTIDILHEYNLKVVGTARGFDRFGKKKKSYVKQAILASKDAEIILLYLGLDEHSETEGLDRKNLSLPSNQLDLIKKLSKLNKKIVVVLTCGAAVELPFIDQIDGLVYGALNGQGGARAMLNILTGKVNPSGKLSETFPLSLKDEPNASYYPGKYKNALYKESIFVGYRYFETANVPVLFPFGYGLSYTTFAYSRLKVCKEGVYFHVTNTGNYKGKEVVQLYIQAQNSSIFRPAKELKGFAKIELNVNEDKEVFLPFDDYTFRYYSTTTNAFEVEALSYRIMVGGSVDSLPLQSEISLPGSSVLKPIKNSLLPTYYEGKVQNVSDAEFEELYGKKIPLDTLEFVRRKRILVDENTCLIDLKYSKGFVGRLLAKVLLKKYKKQKRKHNFDGYIIFESGLFELPIRNVYRMSQGMLGKEEVQGIITMCNGHFHKGFFKEFLPAHKANKKNKKAKIH